MASIREYGSVESGHESFAGTRNSFQPMELRTIRYLGNKRRLAKAICEAIDKVAPAGVPVIDLFAGTCSVGYQLKRHRPVISNDNQMYSYHIAKALIENEGDRPNTSDATSDL